MKEIIRFWSCDFSRTILIEKGPKTKWSKLAKKAKEILGPNYMYERALVSGPIDYSL